jgi:ankyrin repeat protein
MKIFFSILLLLIFNSSLYPEVPENISKNSLPDIEVNVPFSPSIRFYPKRTDFLTMFPEEPYFKPDTINSKNINSKTTEGITPLLSLYHIDSDSITTKRSSETIELTKKYLGLGADPNIQSNLGFTPLMKTCELGMKDAVLLLLDNKANPNLKNYQNRTALHFASRSGNLELVKILLDFKSDPKAIDITGRKPVFDSKTHEIITYLKEKSDMNQEERFILSVIENDTTELSKLILEGVNVNISFSDRKNALMYACENSNMNVVRKLISSGINIDAVDFRGDNALFYATKNGNISIAKCLIENKIDINCENKHNETPLIIAVKNDNFDLIKFLTKNGSEINISDIYGRTALEWSVVLGHSSIMELLLDFTRDKKQMEKLLFWGIMENYTSLVKCLINHGVNINTLNDRKETPLSLAIKNRKYDLAIILLQNGSDPNVRNSLLMDTIRDFKGSESIITITDSLLKYGAELNPKNTIGSPLTVALETGNIELAKWLINKGADINVTGKNGYNTLQTLMVYNRNNVNILDFIKYFIDSGADLNWQSTTCRENVFMTALQMCNLDVVEYMFRKIDNLDVNYIDECERPTILFPIFNKKYENVRYLIELGVNLNISEKINSSVLYTAIATSDSIAVLLLDNNFDFNLRFFNNETPLIFGSKLKQINTIKKLLALGADPFEIDKNGKTAFDHARNNKQILDILNTYKKK